MTRFKELGRRKLVQWGLAYLAGAWVVLQLVDVVSGSWGIGDGFMLALQVILAFGFFITLILAWYHGERGRQRASGPELLMVAGILVVAGAAIAFVRGSGDEDRPVDTVDVTASPSESTLIPERSIAVLPLDNNSPDEDNAYFAGAMTEALTNALQKVPELHVRARNSAAKFAEYGLSVREFALNELGVAHVIEGSVQLVDGHALITVQLIDARIDSHVWSETYEVELVDVLGVQVDVARQVADKLAASFTEREEDRILTGETDDPVAYELFLRARELRSRVPEERDEKIDLLQRALARDPEYGLAWFELATIYAARIQPEEPEWVDSVHASLDRATEFTDDPASQLALRALVTALLDGDYERAAALIREALELDPASLFAHQLAPGLYGASGDLPRAVRSARRLAALNPLSAGGWTELAGLYTWTGLDDHAEAALRRAIEVDPTSTSAWRSLLNLRRYQQRYPEALAAADSMELRGAPDAAGYRGTVQLWAGEEGPARETLEAAYESLGFELFWGFAGELAHLRLLQGDSTEAYPLIDRYEEFIVRMRELFSENTAAHHINDMHIAALRGDVDGAVTALRAYVDTGGRWAVRMIPKSPTLSRVRDDPAFQAELARLERIVERQRRQIERDLAEEAGGR